MLLCNVAHCRKATTWMAGLNAVSLNNCQNSHPGSGLAAVCLRVRHVVTLLCCSLTQPLPCHQVPEGFSQSCMEVLLSYLYTDELPEHMEPQALVQLTHAAAYYGTPRCVLGVLVVVPPERVVSLPDILS